MSKNKLNGYEFWEKTLNKARYVVAPMVDQSELAWRMLSRRYSAELCYTPMFHASVFKKHEHYRREALQTCDGDSPLILQFCGNDPETILESSLMAEKFCDAIDINLGCPQAIARRGNYGAFISDNWELVGNIVRTLDEKLSIPVTCKIRVFDEIEKTVKYAKMLEDAGCQLLTVHGRTREMKGPKTGLASWRHIKAVKSALKIPVFANGNIQYMEDVENCIRETKVDGVMIAEGSLHNPALFTGKKLHVWDISLEYLDLAEKYPCPVSYARGHLFKMCHHALRVHTLARSTLASARNLFELRKAIEALRTMCMKSCVGPDENSCIYKEQVLPEPHWICQPYVRPTSVQHAENKKVPPTDISTENINAISKKKMKKFLKRTKLDVEGLDEEQKASKIAKLINSGLFPTKQTYEDCVSCSMPRSIKCSFLSCKPCCKARTTNLDIKCKFHQAKYFLKQTKCVS